jgi:hypothetical protein
MHNPYPIIDLFDEHREFTVFSSPPEWEDCIDDRLLARWDGAVELRYMLSVPEHRLQRLGLTLIEAPVQIFHFRLPPQMSVFIAHHFCPEHTEDIKSTSQDIKQKYEKAG